MVIETENLRNSEIFYSQNKEINLSSRIEYFYLIFEIIIYEMYISYVNYL